ncbi:hypothetical protein C8J56DRAFT_1169060 [Mycena floridula]|nr:hypothetical protein C8J56DRAFT_1169060 [Mycena floridula]
MLLFILFLFTPLIGAAAFEITLPSSIIRSDDLSGTWTGGDSDLDTIWLIVDFSSDGSDVFSDFVTTSGKSSGVYKLDSGGALKTGEHSVQAFQDLSGNTPLSSRHTFQVIDVAGTTISTARSTAKTSATNQVGTGSESLTRPAITSSSESTTPFSSSVTYSSLASFPAETQGNTSSTQVGAPIKSHYSKRNSIIIGSVLGSLMLIALVTIFVLRRPKCMAQVRCFDEEHLGFHRSMNHGISQENFQPVQQTIRPFPLVTQSDVQGEVKGTAEPVEPRATVQLSKIDPTTAAQNIPERLQQSDQASTRTMLLEELVASSNTRLIDAEAEIERLRLEIQRGQGQESFGFRDEPPPAYVDQRRGS